MSSYQLLATLNKFVLFRHYFPAIAGVRQCQYLGGDIAMEIRLVGLPEAYFCSIRPDDLKMVVCDGNVNRFGLGQHAPSPRLPSTSGHVAGHLEVLVVDIQVENCVLS